MTSETKIFRFPKAEYAGKNGFLSQLTDPAHITDENLDDALERQRRFEFFLEHQKRDVPDFETMEAEVDRKDDYASFKKQIDDLQASHDGDLQRLYDFNVNEYAESIQRQYASRDHTSQQPEVYEAERVAIADLFEGERQGLQNKWNNRYEQLRYAHLSQLVSLTSDKNRAAEEEERERIMLQRAFPLTEKDYDSKPAEFKLRIAIFLTADKARQERFLDEYGWAWRQVLPLCDVFKKDNKFAANVRALLINHRQNATAGQKQSALAATSQKYIPTTDPRKRPPVA